MPVNSNLGLPSSRIAIFLRIRYFFAITLSCEICIREANFLLDNLSFNNVQNSISF